MSFDRSNEGHAGGAGIRTVWITGGHGFIGRHLAASLRTSAEIVAGIGHGAWTDREREQCGFSHWLNSEISLGSLGQMRGVTGNPDIVFHLAGGSSVGAAVANPLEDFKRTVSSTAELLEWLRQFCPETVLVAVSSAAVYGTAGFDKIPESAVLSPVSPYGSHKQMMEELCQSYARCYGIRAVLPRLFSVYGPGLRKQLLWDLCEKIRNGGRIALGGTGAEQRDWVQVADVTRALRAVVALADSTARAVNIATGIATSVRDVALEVIRAWGPDAAGAKVVFGGQSRPGDPANLVADVGLMGSLGLGAAVPLRKGIVEYVMWFRSLTG